MTQLRDHLGACASLAKFDLFPSERRLPLLEELEPLGLIESLQQLVVDRDQLYCAAQLAKPAPPLPVMSVHRVQLGLLHDHRLAALGQKIIDPELAAVRILRVLGYEYQPESTGCSRW